MSLTIEQQAMLLVRANESRRKAKRYLRDHDLPSNAAELDRWLETARSNREVVELSALIGRGTQQRLDAIRNDFLAVAERAKQEAALDFEEVMRRAAEQRRRGRRDIDGIRLDAWSDDEHHHMVDRLIEIAQQRTLDVSLMLDDEMEHADLMLEIGYGLLTAAAEWLMNNEDLGEDKTLALAYA